MFNPNEAQELKLNTGGIVRQCPVCEQFFAAFDTPGRPAQKRCPSCIDRGQHRAEDGRIYIRQKEVRPSVVVERREVGRIPGVLIESLPVPFSRREDVSGDNPHYKIDIAGSEYGAAWDGRIVIYAQYLPKIGETVTIREMVAVHQVRAYYHERSTLEHGSVLLRSVLSLTEAAARKEMAHRGEQDGQAVVDAIIEQSVIETENRAYLVFEPYTGPKTDRRLVWLTSYTKTTLKGLGRQIHSRLVGESLASWQISGGVRSGRSRTVGVLAVLDAEHDLRVETETH